MSSFACVAPWHETCSFVLAFLCVPAALRENMFLAFIQFRVSARDHVFPVEEHPCIFIALLADSVKKIIDLG
jgi:hypothetical protein